MSKNKIKIKSGDTVLVTTGKDSGKTGKVLKVLPRKNKVIIEKINVVKRHSKPTQKNPTGGISDKEMGIDISNVMIYDANEKSAAKIGISTDDKGKRIRVNRKTGEAIK